GTTPFRSAFYVGIEGGYNIEDLAGFTIRIGLSDYGPLDVYVESTARIPLGDTGLCLNDFRGGITFGTAFPDVTISDPPRARDALQLRQPAFSTPDSLTEAQWQAQLQTQVVNQLKGSSSPPGPDTIWDNLTSGPFIVQAGVTISELDPNVLKVDADVFFDTRGSFLVIGTLTEADTLSIGVKMYVNLAPLYTGSQHLDILFLVDNPSQNANPPASPPTYSIFGVATFSDVNNVFQITIAGEEDFNILGGLQVQVTATATLTFTSDSFNITVSNGSVTIPTIQSDPLGTADGSLTIKNSSGNVQVWGGFLMTENLTALNAE